MVTFFLSYLFIYELHVHGLLGEKSDFPHMQSFMLLKLFAFDPFMGFSKCHLKWKGGVQFERTTVELLFLSWSFEYSAHTFIMQK